MSTSLHKFNDYVDVNGGCRSLYNQIKNLPPKTTFLAPRHTQYRSSKDVTGSFFQCLRGVVHSLAHKSAVLTQAEFDDMNFHHTLYLDISSEGEDITSPRVYTLLSRDDLEI